MEATVCVLVSGAMEGAVKASALGGVSGLGNYLTRWLTGAAVSVKLCVPVDGRQACFSLNCLLSFRLQSFPAGISRCCYLNQIFLYLSTFRAIKQALK